MRIFRSSDSLEKEAFEIVASGAFFQMQKACVIAFEKLLRDNNPTYLVVINVLPADEMEPVLLSVGEVVMFLEKLGVKNLIHCSFDQFIQLAETLIQPFKPCHTPRQLFLLCGLSLHGIDKNLFTCFMDSAFSNSNVFEWHQELGYWYTLEGAVVHGNQIGRTLGFPTANLRPFETAKIIPPMGVYCGWVLVHHHWYKSMINIGIRPTLDLHNVTIEAHLFDFDADIYEQPIRICFGHRMRNELRFPSLDLLSMQLHHDRTHALRWFDQVGVSPNGDNFFPLNNQSR